MSVAEQIRPLITAAKPKIAVVFMGAAGPRTIGTLSEVPSAAAVKPTVDSLLIGQSLSATNISIAECFGERFVAAHG